MITPNELADMLAGRDVGEFPDVLAADPAIARIEVENGVKDKLPTLPRWLKIKVEQPSY